MTVMKDWKMLENKCNISIDSLTSGKIDYLASWEMGT